MTSASSLKKQFFSSFIFLLAMVGLSLPLNAALPPSAYTQMQKAAPEQITIKVDSVKHQRWFRKSEIVTATVTAVTKSATKLKVGDKITIKYQYPRRHKKVPGPALIPQLEKGATYPAWLRKSAAGHYIPDAGGSSFSVVMKAKTLQQGLSLCRSLVDVVPRRLYHSSNIRDSFHIIDSTLFLHWLGLKRV